VAKMAPQIYERRTYNPSVRSSRNYTTAICLELLHLAPVRKR
jgi:hypothetical protein